MAVVSHFLKVNSSVLPPFQAKKRVESPIIYHHLPSGKQPHNSGKSPCFMGKLTISMAMFNSYVSHHQAGSHLKSCLVSLPVAQWLFVWEDPQVSPWNIIAPYIHFRSNFRSTCTQGLVNDYYLWYSVNPFKHS